MSIPFPLRGTTISAYDLFYNHLTAQDFVNLKNAGLNTVKLLCNLGFTVWDDATWSWRNSWAAPGNPLTIDLWEQYIRWASDAGLHVIPDLALYGAGVDPNLNGYNFWQPDHYPKVADLWRRLIERFDDIPNVVAYHIIHVPGHPTTLPDGTYIDMTGTSAEWQEVTRLSIDAIREGSNKAISWICHNEDYAGKVTSDPAYPGMARGMGVYYETDAPLWVRNYDPLHNIIYCFNHYSDSIKPPGQLSNRCTHYCDPYHYNIGDLLWFMQPEIDFKNKHNVRILCAEWGIKIDSCGGWPLVDPTRLDWVRDMLILFKRYDVDWVYWVYQVHSPGFGAQDMSIINADHTFRQELVQLLASYVPEEVRYAFDHWEVDGVNVGSANPARIGPITADARIVSMYKVAPPKPAPNPLGLLILAALVYLATR